MTAGVTRLNLAGSARTAFGRDLRLIGTVRILEGSQVLGDVTAGEMGESRTGAAANPSDRFFRRRVGVLRARPVPGAGLEALHT